MKLPRMQDIADEAGVNKCVVSHVLHDDAYAATVRPETRRRILEIAERIGYRRNLLASSIRTGQVNTIAVILDFKHWQQASAASQIMTGLMMEAAFRQYSVKVFSEDDLENSFRSIVENRIGKAIMLSVNHDPRENAARLAEKYSLDLVYAYEHGHLNFPAVNVDNAEMTSKMVHHLAEKGHTRIGLLCVPHWAHYVEERHKGYLRGMEECGLKVDSRWICCSADIELTVKTMLSLPENQRPTAFVALADSVAAKAQSYAIRNGLRFPDDISVIGIGDTDAARQLAYPLTTMREPLQESGKLLVRLVLGEKTDIQPDEFNVYRTHADMIERTSVCDLANRKSQVSSRKPQVKNIKKDKSK